MRWVRTLPSRPQLRLPGTWRSGEVIEDLLKMGETFKAELLTFLRKQSPFEGSRDMSRDMSRDISEDVFNIAVSRLLVQTA